MSFCHAVQSLAFYILSCSPCKQARLPKIRKSAPQMLDANDEIVTEQPCLYRHPPAYSINPSWQSEIEMGPSISLKRKNSKSSADSHSAKVTTPPSSTFRESPVEKGQSSVGEPLPTIAETPKVGKADGVRYSGSTRRNSEEMDGKQSHHSMSELDVGRQSTSTPGQPAVLELSGSHSLNTHSVHSTGTALDRAHLNKFGRSDLNIFLNRTNVLRRSMSAKEPNDVLALKQHDSDVSVDTLYRPQSGASTSLAGDSRTSIAESSPPTTSGSLNLSSTSSKRSHKHSQQRPSPIDVTPTAASRVRRFDYHVLSPRALVHGSEASSADTTQSHQRSLKLYNIHKNPPVNEHHPPVVSSKHPNDPANRWMVEPPPPVKLMAGMPSLTWAQSSRRPTRPRQSTWAG